jgi:PAS domain S-box-containing protein
MREDEAGLGALLEDAGHAILVDRPDGPIVYANARAEKLTGYSGAELRTLRRSVLIRPEDAGPDQGEPGVAIDGGEGCTARLTLLHPKGGQARPVEIYRCLTRWQGAPAALTFLREHDGPGSELSLLREAEASFRFLAETSNDGIVVLASDGVVLYANPTAKTVTGYSTQDFRGGGFPDVIEESERAKVVHLWAARMAGQVVPRRYQTAIKCADGNSRPVEVTASVTSWMGRPADVILFRDLTEQRRTEAELRREQSLNQRLRAEMEERRRAEDALRASERRFRDVAEVSAEYIWELDREERVSFVSDRVRSILGYAPEEILGHSPFEFLWPGEALPAKPDPSSGVSPVLASGHGEQKLRARDGKPVWLRISWKRILDDQGNVAGARGTSVDITEMKLAAEALRRRDQILEAVSFAAGRLLTSGDWTECIDEILARLGQASEVSRCHLIEARLDDTGEIWGRWLRGWLGHGEVRRIDQAPGEIPVRAAGFSEYLDAFSRGQGAQTQYSTCRGEQRATLDKLQIRALLSVPVRTTQILWGVITLIDRHEERVWSGAEMDALQVAGGILGSFIQRQKVQEDLRQSEEKYRTLVESANLPITMVDGRGIYRFANSSAAEDLGRPVEEIVGRSMAEIFPPVFAEEQTREVKAALESGRLRVVQSETKIQGHRRWFESRIQPLHGADGTYDSALIFAADITERRKAEVKILSYQERLRSLASELALTEARERRRIASELHDGIGQALAISKIKLASLRELTPTGPASAVLEDIWRLVDQTIQDTRSLTFQLSSPILYELGFEPAVEWLVEQFYGQQGIPAHFHDDGRSKPLTPDLKVLLFQATRELLLNVVKHAQARKVDVFVRREEATICLEVKDDGIGFAPERILTIGPQPIGFGFLSIRERLGYLGGQVEIISAPGHGTRIILRAPLLPDGSSDERDSP